MNANAYVPRIQLLDELVTSILVCESLDLLPICAAVYYKKDLIKAKRLLQMAWDKQFYICPIDTTRDGCLRPDEQANRTRATYAPGKLLLDYIADFVLLLQPISTRGITTNKFLKESIFARLFLSYNILYFVNY